MLSVGAQATAATKTRYVVAVTADAAADAAVYAALGWLAASRWGPGGAGVVLAANTVPLVLVMLLGGAFADRFGLARQAVVTLGIRTGLMALLAWLVAAPSSVGWWLLVTMAAVLGLVDSFHIPALSGIAGLLADEGGQVRLQGAITAATRAALVAGTMLAGVLVGADVRWAFWAATLLSLLALAVLVLTASKVPHETDETPGVLKEVGAALRAVRNNPMVWRALLLLSVVNCLGTAPIGVGVPSKAAELNWQGAQYGTAYLGFGVGAAVGGAVLSRLPKFSPGAGYRYACLLILPSAVVYAGLALAESPWVAAVCCALAGACMAPIGALLIGGIREQSPAEQMGRISSLIQLGIFSAIPLGHVLYGLVGEAISVTVVGVIAAALLLVAGVVALSAAVLEPSRPQS